MLNQTVFTGTEIKKSFPAIVLNHQAWPKRSEARQILLLSIAACFNEARTDYREVDVNDLIESWIAHFGQQLNLDHVTLRRALVDARILHRCSAGKHYSIIPDPVLSKNVAVMRSLDLEALVAKKLCEQQRNRERYLNAAE